MKTIYKVLIARKSSSNWFYSDDEFAFETFDDANSFMHSFIDHLANQDDVYRAKIVMSTEYIYSNGYMPEVDKNDD